jgi:hypothetical protein
VTDDRDAVRIGTLSTMTLVRGHRSGTASPAAHGPPSEGLLRPVHAPLIASGPVPAKINPFPIAGPHPAPAWAVHPNPGLPGPALGDA